MREDIIHGIIEEKKKVGRTLNEDEIAMIIKNNKVSFFEKKKIVKEGKSGIDDVDYFYNICNLDDNAMTEEKKQFLLLSIGEMEKRANEMSDYIAESEFPTMQLINEYNDYLMKLIYLKNICGISIDEYQSFIGAHEDLYNEIFSSTKKRSI